MEAKKVQEVDGRTWTHNRQSSDVVLIRSLYLPAAIGTLMLGALFGGLGVALVYLGAKGDTHIKMFGANLETADVGIASIFLAVLMVIAIFRSLFKSVEAMKVRHERFEPRTRSRSKQLSFDEE